jgi:hypothetical protein
MDKVVDILLFTTPNSWQVKMEEQNWDPMDHTPTEVVDFMECLKNAKAMDCKSAVVNNSNNKKKPAKKSKVQGTVFPPTLVVGISRFESCYL